MAMLASSASRVRSERRNRALTRLPPGDQKITVVALAANLGRFLNKYDQKADPPLDENADRHK
jgi:hypothetical protein